MAQTHKAVVVEKDKVERLQQGLVESKRQRAELTERQAAIQAEMDAIQAFAEKSGRLDVGKLGVLGGEHRDNRELLRAIGQGIASVEGSLQVARQEVYTDEIAAMRPVERKVIEQYHAWLEDGVRVFDEMDDVVARVFRIPGGSPRVTVPPRIAATVRELARHVQNHDAFAQYNDW